MTTPRHSSRSQKTVTSADPRWKSSSIRLLDENPDKPKEENPEEANQENPEKKLLEDTDDEKELKVVPKNFTELDRLAYVVRAIDIDCSVVPVGAFRLTPNHELRYNDEFKGLSLKDIKNVSNYMHFRNPQTVEKQEFIGTFLAGEAFELTSAAF